MDRGKIAAKHITLCHCFAEAVPSANSSSHCLFQRVSGNCRCAEGFRNVLTCKDFRAVHGPSRRRPFRPGVYAGLADGSQRLLPGPFHGPPALSIPGHPLFQATAHSGEGTTLRPRRCGPPPPLFAAWSAPGPRSAAHALSSPPSRRQPALASAAPGRGAVQSGG
jgi:hypothetical protein